MTEFDNIIIGAGPGGYELAATLAASGENTVVIERDLPGGTCLNRGCIPTKCLCASASALLSVSRAQTFGIDVNINGFDYAAAATRKDKVVDQLRQGVTALLKGCTFINGSAHLKPGRIVEVGNELYKATRRLVIATGSAPAILPVEGADLAITSDEALALTELPESITIIGGGVIGMEFASIFSAMGVTTTVVEYCPEILPPFDPEIAKRLRTSLSRRGVNIIVGACVKRIVRDDIGNMQVIYTGKRGETAVDSTAVLMAVGRKPVVPEGCTEAGIAVDKRGFITVDSLMRTSADGVYAIGDVNGLSMLAHSAIAQGRVVAEENATLFNADNVPSVVFTEPEVAQTGLISAQLQSRDIAYKAIKRPYASCGKACAEGYEGVVKLLVSDDAEQRILGISVLGPHAADLIAEATVLTTDRIPLNSVGARYIHAHPTLSELFC